MAGQKHRPGFCKTFEPEAIKGPLLSGQSDLLGLADQAADGNFHTRARTPELKELREQLKTQQRQRFLLVVGATSTITGALLLTLESIPWLGWVLCLAGIVSLIGGRPR